MKGHRETEVTMRVTGTTPGGIVSRQGMGEVGRVVGNIGIETVIGIGTIVIGIEIGTGIETGTGIGIGTITEAKTEDRVVVADGKENQKIGRREIGIGAIVKIALIGMNGID